MSFNCLKCFEVWDFEYYVCPCCGRATVDSESELEPTLRYEFDYETPLTEEQQATGATFTYDVIRIANGKSVFDEPDNYLNQEEAA